jgi:hypothetical protein
MVRSFKERDGLFAAVDCSSWEDFRQTSMSMLRDHSGGATVSDKYIFRGQSCSSWDLVSSFDRHHAKLSLRTKEERYKKHMALFRENFAIYGDIAKAQSPIAFTDFSSLTDLQIEALAQHYGLHTRLLDWSSSVYVSVFFALSRLDLCQSGLISIWALDLAAFDVIAKAELLLIKDIYPGNIRNLWQMGVFTRNSSSRANLLDVFRSGSMSYDAALEAGNPAIIRFDFPIASEEEMYDDLQMMRINSMTIFPGIEGVVNWIKKKDLG